MVLPLHKDFDILVSKDLEKSQILPKHPLNATNARKSPLLETDLIFGQDGSY